MNAARWLMNLTGPAKQAVKIIPKQQVALMDGMNDWRIKAVNSGWC